MNLKLSFTFLLLLLNSFIVKSQVKEQEFLLNAVNITGYSKEHILNVIKNVNQNLVKNKIDVSPLNYRISEELEIDKLFSLDTIYTGGYFSAKRHYNKSNTFLDKYLEFELSRTVFISFLNNFSYVFSKNPFYTETDLFNYTMQDLDSVYNISFESKNILGSLSINKKTMLPISLSQILKNKSNSGRVFSNYDNKFDLNVEYVIHHLDLKIYYLSDNNSNVIIDRITKTVNLENYRILRTDKRNKIILLNDFYKNIISKISIAKR